MSQGWVRWITAASAFLWIGTAGAQQMGADAPAPLRVSSGELAGLLLKRVDPIYPEAARALHANGAVVLRVLIAATGEVEAVQAVSGPPILFRCMMDAVEQWRYRPYTLYGKAVEVETIITITEQFGRDGPARTASNVEEKDTPAVLTKPPVRVSSGTMAGLLISKVDAVLPPNIAGQVKGSGQVLLDAVISETGEVESLRVVNGDPTLAKYAVDAVKQWKYKPYSIGGEVVEVETTLQLSYLLSASGEARMVLPRRIGSGVSAPKLIFSDEPHYDEAAFAEARKAGWRFGTPLIHLLVDERGFPADVELVHGYAVPKDDPVPAVSQSALDTMNQNAVDTIKHYRFKPAMENGKPVVVELNVEVNIDVF